MAASHIYHNIECAVGIVKAYLLFFKNLHSRVSSRFIILDGKFYKILWAGHRSFNSFLETLTACADLDMVVLSCYDSPALQERLELLRQKGNTVRLHVLESGVTKCG